MVQVLYGSSGGLTAGGGQLWSQDSPGIAGVAEAAGAVNVLYGGGDGLSATGNRVWSQDSGGVADLTEPRDVFGSALAAADLDADGQAELAVGAHGETLDDLTSPLGEAGVTHVLPGSPAGLTGAGSQLWSQDTPGVAGAPEFLDFFGLTLAAS